MPTIAMMIILHLLVATFADVVTAVSTREEFIGHEMSTQTTEATSVITPPPIVHNGLEKRAIATCGYISGNSASPLTCPNGYNCATATHTDPVFGCCNNIECLDDWGWCRDFGQGGCQGYDLDDTVCTSFLGPLLQCSSEAPHCFRYARSSARGDSTTFYSRACGTASLDILVLATATNGANPAPTSPTADEPDNPLTLIPGFSQSLDPTSSPSDPSSSSSSSGPKLSTTSIALISVAGFVVLALALLFGYCCCWRRRDRHSAIVYPTGPVRPPYQQTEPHAPGPGSINNWNLDVPVGASPSVAPSNAGGSEYGGPSGRQMNGQRLYNMHSGGYGSRP
ncbi:hypothetical protein J1614_004534 [Plenodomus biglobosus]|nr:hypothetical protein J1614_004534 [Plenodomus biglobosus]